MSSKFGVPPMRPKDIVSCLAPLEITLDAENLENPHNLQKAYEVFIEWLMGVTRDELEVSHHSPEAMSELHAHRSLYEDAARRVLLIHYVGKLFNLACIRDYDYTNDHLQPSKRRVIQTLSSIINFAMFREERIVTYEKFVEQSDHLSLKRNELASQNLQLQKELDMLRAQRAEAEPHIVKLQGENRELGDELAALHREEQQIRSKTTKIFADLEDLKAQNQKEEEALTSMKQTVRRLKSQIVESPEKTKKYIEGLTKEVEKNKEEIKTGERRNRELSARNDVLVKTEREILKTVEMVNGCNAENAKSKKFGKEIKETLSKIEESEKKKREMEAECLHLLRQIKLGEEKALLDADRFRSKMQQTEQMKERERAKLNSSNREAADAKQKIKVNDDVVRGIEGEISTMERQHSNEMAALREQREELELSVREYHSRLMSAMTCTI